MKNTQKICLGIAASLYLLCTVLSAYADEKLPVLKVGGEVYSNVTVTSVTATDVYFTHTKGVANAKLKNLEPALQKHFGFDAARAEAAALQQKQAASPSSLVGNSTAEPAIDRSNAKSARENAIARVKAIVNQPVRAMRQTPDMVVANHSPGWFHDGATEPDYATVDVRTTQDTRYGQHQYVTSDLNPGVVFAGADVEFNSNTKFFYVDRSLPKKKLTEPEMLEVNRLYRVIAKCDDALQPQTVLAAEFLTANRKQMVYAVAALIALLIPIRLLMSRRTA